MCKKYFWIGIFYGKTLQREVTSFPMKVQYFIRKSLKSMSRVIQELTWGQTIWIISTNWPEFKVLDRGLFPMPMQNPYSNPFLFIKWFFVIQFPKFLLHILGQTKNLILARNYFAISITFSTWEVTMVTPGFCTGSHWGWLQSKQPHSYFVPYCSIGSLIIHDILMCKMSKAVIVTSRMKNFHSFLPRFRVLAPFCLRIHKIWSKLCRNIGHQCVLANLSSPEICNSDLSKLRCENRELENEENWWYLSMKK